MYVEGLAYGKQSINGSHLYHILPTLKYKEVKTRNSYLIHIINEHTDPTTVLNLT